MSKKRAETRTINVKRAIEKKDEPDDRAEWLMISLTASMSTRDGVFGRDRYGNEPVHCIPFHTTSLIDSNEALIKAVRQPMNK
jgi:hypothetical protein